MYGAFKVMLQEGMTYYTGHLNDVIRCEMNVFCNMLEVIHLWSKKSYDFGPSISKYLKYNRKDKLNLEKVNLEGLDLKIVILINANLKETNLKNTDFTGANLSGANLEGAEIENIDLKLATLTDTIFDESQVQYLEKSYDLRGIKIHNRKTDEITGYKEYYGIKRKRKTDLIS